jgi:multiple sugar transport system substrate-binding protein
MKLSQRRSGVVVLAASVSVALAACSGTNTTSSSAPASSAPVKGSVQLSYWGSSGRVTKTNQIAQLFAKKYPNASVQPTAGDFTTYFQKLNVQAASQTMPCVTGLQTRQLNDYTKNGTMMDLDPLVKSGAINVSSIPKSVLNSGRGPDGKLYMIPYGVAWNSELYNGAMAKKYGITALPNTYTWKQFGNWLKEAKAKLPASIPAADEQGGVEAMFSAYVIGNGEKMFTSKGQIAFSKKTLTNYWNMWEKFRKEGLTNSEQDNVSEGTTVEQSYLVTGKVFSEQQAGNWLTAASVVNPSANLQEVPFASGKAGLGNMFFTSGWSIPTACSNKSTAAAFINFWTNNNQSASIFASDNGAVANKTQLAAQIKNPDSAALKTELQQYNFMLSKKVPQPTIPSGYNATFEQSFLREYQNIAFGKETVKQGVDAFFTEANAALGK